MKKSFIFLSSLAFTFVFLRSDRTDACGGCFAPPPVQQSETTVVTDHRMALSISSQQTVLWDQIRYTGDPREFAWVLPVRAGATVEVSNDEWFTALDASTQPVVYSPSRYGGRFGCGLTGCGESSAASGESASPGAGQVQILSQSVVGPYETVTLRATDDDALRIWLRSHGYAIPPSIEPTISEYVDEGFDFIALRLLPECGERAMKPVRIVTRGADPTLPLRMVAAGVGARVGLTLFVISEGRWETQSFPNATIATSRVRWDRFQNRSNYDVLSREAMEAEEGRTWLTEYAQRPQLPAPGYSKWNGVTINAPSSSTPGLTDVFYGRCAAYTPRTLPRNNGTSAAAPSSTTVTPCTRAADAGVATDGGDSGIDDAGATDAGEAGAPDAGSRADAGTRAPSYDPDVACDYLDDLDVALRGLRPGDVWITRLRALLPANALSAGDLRLAAATRQTPVSNEHYAQYYADEDAPEDEERSSCASSPKEHRTYGAWSFAIGAAIAWIAVRRRRARR